jgi:hypothetical protein
MTNTGSDGRSFRFNQIQARADLVDQGELRRWWKALFCNVEWSFEHLIEVRKLGYAPGFWTDGNGVSTPGTILYEDTTCLQPALAFDAVPWLEDRAILAAKVGVGCYMAPAVLNYRKANDESLVSLVCITLDLDVGDTEAARKKAEGLLGPATLVVGSGGTTPEGMPKMHLHWRLTEPETDTVAVGALRKLLAAVVGGDSAFGRPPQVVRIPGTVYDKIIDQTTGEPKPGTKYRTVRTIQCSIDQEIEFSDAQELVVAAAVAMDIQIDQGGGPAKAGSERTADGGFDFSTPGTEPGVTKEQSQARHEKLMGEIVQEGGSPEDSRWQRFTEYAGRWIVHARLGDVGIDTAFANVDGWVQTNMDPPWGPQRIQKEFRAILAVDRKNHEAAWLRLSAPAVQFRDNKGAGDNTPATPNTTETGGSEGAGTPSPGQPETGAEGPSIFEDYKAEDLFMGDAPKVDWLVKNLLVAKTIHALVADGGVGKTYTALEIGLKCAIGPDHPKANIFGFPVQKACEVVILTVEDGRDDLHRRFAHMDPDRSMLKATKGRLKILPIADEIVGGLTIAEKDDRGNYMASKAWEFLVGHMGKLNEGHGPDLVIIDTYSATLHGDENSSVTANEWFRFVQQVRMQFGSAIIVTHHIKKPMADVKLRTVEQFKSLIRGSTAFVNNCRIVFGLWPIPYDDPIYHGNGLEQGTKLFNFSLAKSNTALNWTGIVKGNPDDQDPSVLLRRLGNGSLIWDAVLQDIRENGNPAEQEAKGLGSQIIQNGIETVLRRFAEAGHPLKVSEASMTRKDSLPYFPIQMHALQKKTKSTDRGDGYAAYEVAKALKAMRDSDRVVDLTTVEGHNATYLAMADDPIVMSSIVSPLSGRNPRPADINWDGWEVEDGLWVPPE